MGVCHLGVTLKLLSILEVRSSDLPNPHFGVWIGIFKLNVQNIKNCILSKLLHRFEPNFAQLQRPPKAPNTLRACSK